MPMQPGPMTGGKLKKILLYYIDYDLNLRDKLLSLVENLPGRILSAL